MVIHGYELKRISEVMTLYSKLDFSGPYFWEGDLIYSLFFPRPSDIHSLVYSGRNEVCPQAEEHRAALLQRRRGHGQGQVFRRHHLHVLRLLAQHQRHQPPAGADPADLVLQVSRPFSLGDLAHIPVSGR